MIQLICNFTQITMLQQLNSFFNLLCQVAIDQMQNKVKELQTVITANPPDMKKLQLKLQGSISATVCIFLLKFL